MTPELSAEISAWQRRDEAWGRMLSATAEGDDEAYERARQDFWNTEGEIE